MDRLSQKSTSITHNFLSIDAEGYDLEILMSNDWNKFRPSVVLVEDQTADLTSMTENDIYKYMADKGYKLFAKTFYTVFYVEKGFI